ncbi:hypothetical protein EMPG_13260 [Blastomyces silverae]|uniref:PXA domain-containing protein n=1 Tax=Blastomyces silverae TaxID=2060906 RepID=A0A0H1BKA1_9EURO|nr:hypothetical protein EMPG_13260 [Blastomyces silverae]
MIFSCFICKAKFQARTKSTISRISLIPALPANGRSVRTFRPYSDLGEISDIGAPSLRSRGFRISMGGYGASNGYFFPLISLARFEAPMTSPFAFEETARDDCGLILETFLAHLLTPFSRPPLRFLHETIQKRLFTPTFLPVLLLAIRTTLFPFNTKPSQNANISTLSPSTSSMLPQAEAGINSDSVGTSSLTPSPPSAQLPVTLQTWSESQALSKTQENMIKRECAASIISLIPRRVALTIFCIPTLQAKNPEDKTLNLVSPKIIRTTSHSGSRAPNAVTGYDAQQSSSSSQKYTVPDPRESGTSFPASQPSTAFTTTNIQSTVTNRKSKNSAGDAPIQTAVLSPSEYEANAGGDDENDNEESNEQEALLSAIEHDILDIFADKYCNKHLMYSIIETVLVKLLPEISEHGIAELMAERGV